MPRTDPKRPAVRSTTPAIRPAGPRAPHLVIEQAGKRSAIHDHFGKTFTLLAGADGRRWADAAAAIGRRGELALPAIRIGGDAIDVAGRFASVYGVGPEGAVLVRPDGFIAWRARGPLADPERTLREVLSQILDHRVA
jgi:putative polyketide hydroxylase